MEGKEGLMSEYLEARDKKKKGPMTFFVGKFYNAGQSGNVSQIAIGVKGTLILSPENLLFLTGSPAQVLRAKHPQQQG